MKGISLQSEEYFEISILGWDFSFDFSVGWYDSCDFLELLLFALLFGLAGARYLEEGTEGAGASGTQAA